MWPPLWNGPTIGGFEPSVNMESTTGATHWRVLAVISTHKTDFRQRNSTADRALRLLVLAFEALDKSTMAHVFFRISNLKNDYPNQQS